MKADEKKALAEVLAGHPHILAGLAFGSLQRGTARADSDLDVAVLPSRPLTAPQKIALIEALAQQFGRPVDVVDLSVHHGVIAHEAMSRGELVYCRDRLAYAERLRRMVYDQEDFVPVLRRADRMAIEKWLKTSYASRSGH